MTTTMTDADIRRWGAIQHLSLFLGYLIPGAGFLAALVIWQMKKNEHPDLDAHGKNAVNWAILFFFGGLVVSVLFFTIILIPVAWLLGLALGLCAVAFPIIAAIKASAGEVWKYPFTPRLVG